MNSPSALAGCALPAPLSTPLAPVGAMGPEGRETTARSGGGGGVKEESAVAPNGAAALAAMRDETRCSRTAHGAPDSPSSAASEEVKRLLGRYATLHPAAAAAHAKADCESQVSGEEHAVVGAVADAFPICDGLLYTQGEVDVELELGAGGA
ncbi:hypothetical protein FGB62_43g115 [Gracilaria domingensis]|nr:hypothetical protein FGB62_43g115 [Gracilaria domingensis]